ncbi:4'-phosphopantetheinyl transferase superfamily protein [Sinomonas atrocyanea]
MGGPGNPLAAAVRAALPAGIAVGASAVRPASPSEPPHRGQHRAGREAAAAALCAAGVPTEQPLPRTATGSAAWPAGTTGSISHTNRIALAVAAASAGFRRLGVDLEEAAALPEGVLELVSSDRQLAGLAEVRAAGGGLPLDLVVFSAKEAAAKALGGPEACPPSLRDIDVTLVAEHWAAGRFVARGPHGQVLGGRYLEAAGHVVTACWQGASREVPV